MSVGNPDQLGLSCLHVLTASNNLVHLCDVVVEYVRLQAILYALQPGLPG